MENEEDTREKEEDTREKEEDTREKEEDTQEKEKDTREKEEDTREKEEDTREKEEDTANAVEEHEQSLQRLFSQDSYEELTGTSLFRATHPPPALRIAVPVVAKHAKSRPEVTFYGRDTDPFPEDETERKFLRSKPLCFMILGKPGSGKTTLAKQFADEWKCELLNGATVISELVKKDTALATECAEALNQGNELPEIRVFQILNEKIGSPEVAHRGYVLDDLPCLSESTMTISDQLVLIKTWKLQPDFLIHIRISDEDLLERRRGLKVDPVFGGIYTKDVYAPDIPVKPQSKNEEEDEEEDEEEEDSDTEEKEEELPKLPKNVVERLVVRLEDMSPRLEEAMEFFHTKISGILETLMASHDPQCIIHVDGNLPAPVLAKQLVSKLQCFLATPVAVVQKLMEVSADEEEDFSDDVAAMNDMNTEDLLRSLNSKLMVAPHYRWRRSRWLRYCPVALYDGRKVLGKAEFAVSFLDKMYCLSDALAQDKFVKNPRPYLLPPQPRPPCKVCVLGPPLSGKTTLCKILAHKYNAEVLDVERLIQPCMTREKQKLIKRVTKESTAQAIDAIENAAKEEADRAAAARELARAQAEAAAAAEEEVRRAEREKMLQDTIKEEESGELNELQLGAEPLTPSEKLSEELIVLPESSQTDVADTVDQQPQPQQAAHEDDLATPTEQEPVPVDANHPEVVRRVQAALTKAQNEPMMLPAEVIVEIVENVVRALEKARHEESPDSPNAGGWVLDGFPSTGILWNACMEKQLVPDSVVVLNDESERGIVLARRYYSHNWDDLLASKKARLERERLEALRIAEEKSQEEKRLKEEEERLAEEEARQQALENTSDVETDDQKTPSNPGSETATDTAREATTEAAKPEEEAGQAEAKEIASSTMAIPTVTVTEEVLPGKQRTDEDAQAEGQEGTLETVKEDGEEDEQREGADKESAPSEEEPPEIEDIPTDEILKSPEMAPYYKLVATHEVETSQLLLHVSSVEGVQTLTVDVHDKSLDTISEDVIQEMEKPLDYQPWEYSLFDMDEEDDDRETELALREEEEEEGADEEEEEDEDGDSIFSRRKQMGDTSHYCPVAMKESHVLRPGNDDWGARFRERLYCFSSPETRDRFLEDPSPFLAHDKPLKPPPIRLMIVGVRGSGKTVFGKHLAEKLGLIHIAFKERLQEILLPRTKTKVVPPIDEYQLEEIENVKDDDEEEEKKEEEKGEEGEKEGETEGPVLEDGQKKEDEGPQGEGGDGGPGTLESRKLSEANKIGLSDGGEKEKEEEEEEEIELTEEEEMIKQAIVASESLTDEFLDTLITQWWTKEPFCSKGFVLEGFPRTSEEVTFLAEKGLFPDAVVVLNLSEEGMIARLLPAWMEHYKKKTKAYLAKKEKAQKKRDKAIQKRRDELLKERETRRAERRAEESSTASTDYDSEELEEEESDDEEDEDIDALLAEEFPDDEEEEEEEMGTPEAESEAVSTRTEELSSTFSELDEQLDGMQQALEDSVITKISIDAGRRPHIVRYLLYKHLRPYVELRHALLERAFPVTETMALRMLTLGYKQLSRFGRWCPFKLQEGDCLAPYYDKSVKERKCFPCVYRQYMFFLHSAAARESFLKDPLTPLRQPSPGPMVPLRMAIVGPPQSGKSTLARRFVEEYGVVRLSIGEALRTLLTTQPKCHLARQIRELLVKGLVVTQELEVQALDTVIMADEQCQTRGYVLDGYPMMARQMELMEERNIVPFVVVRLEMDDNQVLLRGTKNRTSPSRTLALHDSEKILRIRTEEFRSRVVPVVEFYTEQHQNVVPVDPMYSKWCVWNRTLEVARRFVRSRHDYLRNRQKGKAAPMADTGVTPAEFQKKLGEFGQYCPVSLAQGKFEDGARFKSLEFAAEFKDRYYKTAGPKELQTFLDFAEKLVGSQAPRELPPAEWLPRRRLMEDMQYTFRTVEMQGYCPVTYLDGMLRYEALEPGNPEFVVEYRDKLYCLESEDKLWKFMRTPEMYSYLELPHKVPPGKESMPVTGLPMLGYLEEGVSSALIAALTAAGNFKPKYPFLSPARSALLYTAFHLKAFNPKSSTFLRKKYKQKLEKFEETCNLIHYLGDTMPTTYRPPEDLSPEFTAKLDMFLALRDVEPTTNWIG